MVLSEFPSDVGVAIVAHNAGEQLHRALGSLDAAGCPGTAILVVDVASTDDTRRWLQDRYPDVRLHRLERNDGPDPARNAGITLTKQPYVFLMDGDVTVQPETIQRLRQEMAAD